MTFDEAFRGYDTLWRELRRHGSLLGAQHRKDAEGASPTDTIGAQRAGAHARDEINARMAQHAWAAYALYKDGDTWRSAMWKRRALLHEMGKTGVVYGNNNPIEWCAVHEARQSGTYIPQGFGRSNYGLKETMVIKGSTDG